MRIHSAGAGIELEFSCLTPSFLDHILGSTNDARRPHSYGSHELIFERGTDL